MTTPKRRTKAAWLIGGVLLLGIGMMVWGNWLTLKAKYYAFKVEEASTQGLLYTDQTISNLRNLASCEEAAIPYFKAWVFENESELGDEFLVRMIYAESGEASKNQIVAMVLERGSSERLQALKVLEAMGIGGMIQSSNLDLQNQRFLGHPGFEAEYEKILQLLLDDPNKDIRENAAGMLMNLEDSFYEYPEPVRNRIENIFHGEKAP